MTNAIERPNKFAQGIFLELQNQDGALGTPMWVSFRGKCTLTKQINQATVFANAESALETLRMLTQEDLHLANGSMLVVSERTYNTEIHHEFWRRMKEGKPKQGTDYSYFLITAQQQLEQLNHALINGPDELARTLSRELFDTILDLNLEVGRYLNRKLDEADRRN